MVRQLISNNNITSKVPIRNQKSRKARSLKAPAKKLLKIIELAKRKQIDSDRNNSVMLLVSVIII